jgi:transketolase
MLDATLTHKGPVYMRISVDPVDVIYDDTYEFTVGKASLPRGGEDGAFICSGSAVSSAVAATDELSAKCGVNVRVVDVHTIKPLDTDAIISAARTGHIVVAQDHNTVGGLGDAVARVLAENGLSCDFSCAGIPDKFTTMAHAPYLYHKFGYDAEGLFDRMKRSLNI